MSDSMAGGPSYSVADARKNFSQLVEGASERPVFIERHGKLAAVLVSPEEFEKMVVALEEFEDIEAIDMALAEGDDNIPWDEVKADLGWM
ncbi:MAG: type II toxin-antitoxin system Phd/YefM family antitoxin [Microbacteriaceae bacterium]